jgi:hypothetical protein
LRRCFEATGRLCWTPLSWSIWILAISWLEFGELPVK